MSEPTRYELAAWNTDGRRLLIAYVAGSPSRSRMRRTIQERGEWIVSATGLPEDAEFHFGEAGGRSSRAECIQGWTFGYTGRTKRDAKAEGELPFIGAGLGG